MPLCPHTRGTAPIPSQPPGRPARSPGGAGPHLAQEGLPAAAAGGADLVGRHQPPPAAPGVQEVLHVPHGRAGTPGHRGTGARPPAPAGAARGSSARRRLRGAGRRPGGTRRGRRVPAARSAPRAGRVRAVDSSASCWIERASPAGRRLNWSCWTERAAPAGRGLNWSCWIERAAPAGRGLN